MNEQDKAAFEEWFFSDSSNQCGHPESIAENAFEAGMAHRDRQAAQAEPVASAGRIYAWVYVDQYGIDSAPTAKEWCEEMIRLHGGSMFPLYTHPPQPVQQAQAEPVVFTGWYCAQCQRGVDPSEVSFYETHTVCGRYITDDEPPAQPVQPAVAVNETDLGVLRELAATLEFRSPERHKALSKLIAAAEAAKGGV